MPNNITIIGAGAWGTTLSILFAENKHNVVLWAHEKGVVKEINDFGENKKFLKGIQLPKIITATNNLDQATEKADLIVFVVPTQHLREVIKNTKTKVPILSAAKGIEIKTGKRPSEILKEHFKKDIAVISGPNLAHEIAKGLPAASVVAAIDEGQAKQIQKLLMSQRFRVYTQNDTIGVEIGGALKNIIAIASGIVDGLALGENARSGLIVRGIREIASLGQALGAKEQTFYGLSGIGDLILTCGSTMSRNHSVGVKLAEGLNINQITSNMQEIAEGITTTKAVDQLAKKLKIEMPITSQIFEVLFKKKDPYLAAQNLLSREAKTEN